MSQVLLPKTMEELWTYMEGNPQALLYAGGTDLLVKNRSSAVKPDCLICMERMKEWKGVRIEGSKIIIGALTTHREMLDDPIIQKDLPLLAQALKSLGSPPIRNMGTLGGNIVTASPAGDTLAPLYILKARLNIRSKRSNRSLPIESFILGPGKVDLHTGEILSEVVLGKSPGFTFNHYEKVGRRNALACSVVSMAALMNIEKDNAISEIRLAWGSVGPTIMRFEDIERLLEGKPLTAMGIEAAIRKVQQSVSPIDDIRASAAYRREVAGRLLLGLLSYSCST
ncbi:MAG: xanthine dehydrogenase family protein subunit M [Pseudomonadota bacterium]